ncbi:MULTISPECIES: nuclear transport factor 2 family protein [unclassified Streptomyces]|uniref:nuclear transport factor 2 family protein n=1 Tax=unclassified Streptomyces TaxID=2593676 RepID=UPI002E7FCFEA|nr:nuclear transport factor 2 family protein [Streptomyces sp. NBC_00589]WTI38541.1 nuclear transport factor 2 family protein [Streptomyces sp. NBC_00775]WUB27780.1 nuclear transport factor 2 family protein [Streptomyces sp. NBC_00589]
MASFTSTPAAAPPLPAAADTASATRLAALEERLSALEDQAQLTALVDRFVHGLDNPGPLTEDWYRTLLTEQVRLNLPNGTHAGITGLPEFLAAPKAFFAGNQHYATNCAVDVDGDRATAHANLHAIHIPLDDSAPLFTGGAHYDVRAERTPAGWRIAELTVSVLWTAQGVRG